MIRFGGFIITYNRPEILKDTLSKIFKQTHPPEVLWIIDNSEDLKTDLAVATLLDPRLKYFRMGFNSGPAGAAKKGLELCGKENLDWIYWGDDNDPPFEPDCFERLLSKSDFNPFCGIIGSVGQFFDRQKGIVKRVQTRLLEKKDVIGVDYVAGGKSMIIKGEIARKGIFPNPNLFFGFEELDFCLKVKRQGFEILVDCGLFLESRERSNRLDYERPIYAKKNNLNREYYSLRNLLMISDTLTLNKMKRRLYSKWILKAFYGFRYGPQYGLKNFKVIWLAFFHYWGGKVGKTLDLY